MAAPEFVYESVTANVSTLQDRMAELLSHLHTLNDQNFRETSGDHLSKYFPEIIEILQQIKVYLTSVSNNYHSEVLTPDMKSVHQFLDSVDELKHLKLHSDINRLIFDCVFNLFHCEGSQFSETSQRSWVISKLRNCLTYTDVERQSMFDQLGLHEKLICEKVISVLTQHITNLKSKTNSVNGKLVPRISFIPPDSLADICHILICLLHNSQLPNLQTLLESFLDYFSTQPSSVILLDFYQKLYDLEPETIYESENSSCGFLSDSSRCKLYTSYRPSLEREVLSLIAASMGWTFCRKHMQRIMECRGFPKICAEDSQLFLESSIIFHYIFEKDLNVNKADITEKRQYDVSSMFTIISVFYHIVHGHTTEYSYRDDSLSIYSLYPSYLREMVKEYLQIPYRDVTECIQNMKSFFQRLETWKKCAEFNVSRVWVYSQHFRLKFVAYLLSHVFTVAEADLDCWLVTLLWFFQADISPSCFELLRNYLRVFLKETKLIFGQHDNVEWDSIQTILPPMDNDQSGTALFKSITDSLLLTFIVYSQVDINVVDHMLQFIAEGKGDNSVHSRLFLLLSAESLLQYGPKRDRGATQGRYITLIEYYRSECDSSLSQNIQSQITVGCDDVIKYFS